MWDNRLSKKNPAGPDFKCKTATCLDAKTGFVTALWLKDLQKKGAAPRAAAPAPVKQPFSSGAPLPWEGEETGAPPKDEMPHEKLDRLFALYRVCYAQAMETVSKTFKNDEPSQVAVSAVAATLFIAAKERGLAA